MDTCSTCPADAGCQWSEANEQLLRHIAKSATLWAKLHGMANRSQNKISLFLGIPIAILNTFTTSSIFYSATLSNSNWVNYAASALSLSTNILVGVYANLQPLVNASEHLAAEKVAMGICDEISRVVASSHVNRPPPSAVIPVAQYALTEIRDNPQLSSWIAARFTDDLHSSFSPILPPYTNKIALRIATTRSHSSANGSDAPTYV